jgi:hypothetical protein
MPDAFDPYREALVMETETVWPEGYDDWDPARRASLEEQLHSHPDQAGHLQYIRTHTGFCRRIVITPDDIERLAS